MQRNLDAILADVIDEPSTLEAFLVRIAQELATFCETPHCEVWVFRARASDELRLDLIAAHPRTISGDELVSGEELVGIAGNSEALLAHSPTYSLTHEPHHSTAAHLRVLTLSLGMYGFVVLAREHHSINQATVGVLRSVVARVTDAVAARLPQHTLVQLNRRLQLRSEVDRRLARAFADVRTLVELAATIQRLAAELFAVEHSSISFLDPESAQLMRVCATAVQPFAMDVDASAMNIDASPHEVLRTGRVIELAEATKPTQSFANLSREQCVRLHSRLYIPVHVDGVVIGCIGFASTNGNTVPSQHRPALSMLADFAGLTYARVAVQHGQNRGGALMDASRVATERLLGAVQWLPCANAALAIVGSAMDAGTLALVELSHEVEEQDAQTGSTVSNFALNDAHDAHPKGRSVECVWHPTFGLPWMHGRRLSRLMQQERIRLTAGQSVTVAFDDASHPTVLKPIVADGVLWGVLAHESRVDARRELDVHELVALRTLANSFTSVIVRERLHEAVHRRHKFDAVGVLAQRVAQEFNTLLWPILTYTEILEGMPSMDKRAQELLREIAQAGRRASDLAQQVLTISHRPDCAFELVAVSTMVMEVSAMFRRMAPPSVSVHDSIDTDSGVVLGDVNEFREVLMTLATSAFDAMKQSAGAIRFHVERIERKDGEWIRLLVCEEIDESRTDATSNSEGSEAHTRDETFTMFRGNAAAAGSSERHHGFAMAHVQRVVAHMGGTVTVLPDARVGTSVELLLPVHDTREMSSSLAPEPSISATEPTHARRILLVDDDASVLQVATEMLVSCGYNVTACPTAAHAIECLSDASLDLSLLLTDFNMPVMDGIVLARESKRLRRTLPVVCITGFGTAATERRAMEAGVNAFMRKPMDIEQLALVIEGVIREANQATQQNATDVS